MLTLALPTPFWLITMLADNALASEKATLPALIG